jgi:hypothetical protein
MKFNKSMFSKIQESLEKTAGGGGGGNPNFLRISQEGTYVLKLLCDPEAPEDTTYTYFEHGWESFSTGRFMTTVSLQSFSEPDPISDAFWTGIKSTDEDVKERYKKLSRRDKHLLNVYVVSDSVNPENDGTVKVLKFSRQIKEIIDAALLEGGDDYEEFGGERVFGYDDGVVLKIPAYKKGPFISYDKSKFVTKPVVKLSDEEVDEIYGKRFVLKDQIGEIKSYDELKEILDEHWFAGENLDLLELVEDRQAKADVKRERTAPKRKEVIDEEDEIPFGEEDATKSKAKPKAKKVEVEDDDAPDESNFVGDLLGEFGED